MTATSMGATADARTLLRAFDVAMLAQAAHYDVGQKDERSRSVKDVELLFFRLLRGLAPPLFIEAGAKDAGSSRRARKMFPDARVVAFEANPYTYRRFAKVNADANAVEYLHLALDREPGTVRFNVRLRRDGKPHADGQGSLTKRFNHPDYQQVEVTSTSLDTFFGDFAFERCALWVDVEGANEQVLTGGRGVLQKTSLCLIEIEDRMMWQGQSWHAIETMQAFFAAGLVPVARDFQSKDQYNLLFVREAWLDDDHCRRTLADHFSALGSSRTIAVAQAATRRKLEKLASNPVAFVKDSWVYQRYFGAG
jgi:FkbM family methyltransferase